MVQVHTETVELLHVAVALLLQVTNLHIFVDLIRHQIQDLLLLLLIVLEHLVVVHFHLVVLGGDLLHAFLSLLVLA